MTSPAAPPNTAALQTRFTRLRYGPPASAIVPSSPPVAGSTPSVPWPSRARHRQRHADRERRADHLRPRHRRPAAAAPPRPASSGTTTSRTRPAQVRHRAPISSSPRTTIRTSIPWSRTGRPVTAPSAASVSRGRVPAWRIPGIWSAWPRTTAICGTRPSAAELTANGAELPRLDHGGPGTPRRAGVPAQGDADAHRGGAAGVAAAVAWPPRRRWPRSAGPTARCGPNSVPAGPASPRSTWYEPDQTVAFWIRRMALETVDPPDRRRTGGRPARHPVPD